MVSSSTMHNFPSPLRINFAGEVVRDEDVEEVLRKVASPERKSLFFSQGAEKSNMKSKWYWFRTTRKNNTEAMPREIKQSREFDDSASDDIYSDSGSSFGDGSATVETLDTKLTYETRHTIATLNTMQYEEFVTQEKQEDGWSSFFCGVCSRGDYDNDDDYSRPSILTRTKPVNNVASVGDTTAYALEPKRTLSISSDSDWSEEFGSDYTGETEQLLPMIESSLSFNTL